MAEEHMHVTNPDNELQFDVTVEASNVFCEKDGKLLQLWVDAIKHTPHEWRPLPTYNEAIAKYGCETVTGL